GVSFDGWKEMFCQFWEAKARYDQFLINSMQKKKWWKGDRSAINQAGRHQAVSTINQPLKVVWFFMQPISYAYFKRMFVGFNDIIVRYQP
ncbi:Tox-REase-5 domain-containing protein, partial [Enterobacter cloacae]|uniref:Tox-REase-5 domain-containing protein n=2 Tax=Enterobacter cloacae TaxID=550 RepID=UPI0006662887